MTSDYHKKFAKRKLSLNEDGFTYRRELLRRFAKGVVHTKVLNKQMVSQELQTGHIYTNV